MNKEVLVPDKTSEIPLYRYGRLMSLEEDERDDFVTIFSTITGCTKDEAKQVRAVDVERAMNAIVKALMDTKNAPLYKMVEHNGVRYGLEPQMDEMTLGMLADLTEHLALPSHWPEAMAILYRPIDRETKSMGGLYSIEPYKYGTDEYMERVKSFSYLPADVFIGVRAFFLNGMMDLERYISASLKIESQKEQPKTSSGADS